MLCRLVKGKIIMKTFEEFLYELAQKESGGNYKAKNWANYLGKYQMGESALIDTGYYQKKHKGKANDWTGQFTGKDGVNSVEDFLNNPIAQENAQREYLQKQWSYIKDNAENFKNKDIKGNPVTYSGLLAGAHNSGNGYANIYMKTDGKIDHKDGNGVPISEYIDKFSGYDVSEVTKTIEPRSIYEKLLKSTDTRIKSPVFKSGYSSPTGYAAPINGFMQSADLTGWKNPVNRDNRIYTAEDIGDMTHKEFGKLERIIDAQMNSIGIPRKKDLGLFSGGSIYIAPYTRADGIKVRGHYRALRY